MREIRTISFYVDDDNIFHVIFSIDGIKREYKTTNKVSIKRVLDTITKLLESRYLERVQYSNTFVVGGMW